MTSSRLLPHPLMSVVLLMSWLWMNNTLAPGHVVLGALLGFAIPLFTRRFWPEPLPLAGPLKMVAFLALVMCDIVIANVQVARVILGPRRNLQPGFVRVPLDLRTDFAITVFASTISLTPGTVSVELAPDRRFLYVHLLSSAEPEQVTHTVKQRYERRIKEIFE